MYEYKKVNSEKTTSAKLDKLLAEGWEAVGALEDKVDEKGKVVVKKSHIIRFRRALGKSAGDDVVLSPDKVFARIGIKTK